MGFPDIKIVASEVDGVITEGLAGIGEMDVVMFKQYYLKDFEAINRIKRDYKFVIISSDASINQSLCRQKNIPYFFSKDKYAALKQVMYRYECTADNILYVGASYSDKKCMRIAGLSMCPEDSPAEIINTAEHVIPHMGGTGVLCYVYDFLMANRREDA
jgi:3-deoxy-D-manno-octulosonate 8-phosphate phosphatase (KDO 8-P phosphatase)